MERTGIIYGINGPIVYLKGDPGFKMNELVYVGTENLVGEVIGLTSERTTIEVYEETSGLKPGIRHGKRLARIGHTGPRHSYQYI